MSTINVADQAIARAALASILDKGRGDDAVGPYVDAVLRAASKVRFQPSTRQLVLTFDLAFNTSEPDTSGPVQ